MKSRFKFMLPTLIMWVLVIVVVGWLHTVLRGYYQGIPILLATIGAASLIARNFVWLKKHHLDKIQNDYLLSGTIFLLTMFGVLIAVNVRCLMFPGPPTCSNSTLPLITSYLMWFTVIYLGYLWKRLTER